MIFLQIAILIVGFVLLMKGADMFVDGAGKVAVKFGIPDIIIGLTIVALGTSLPELVTSVIATKKGEYDIAIGNILGANILNIVLIVGAASVITPVKYNLTPTSISLINLAFLPQAIHGM